MNVSFDYICYMIFKKDGTLPIIVRHKERYFDGYEMEEAPLEEVLFFIEEDYKKLVKESTNGIIDAKYDMNKYRSIRNLAQFKLDLGRKSDFVVDDYNKLKIDINKPFITGIYTKSFKRIELLNESIRKEFNELIDNKIKYLKYLISKLKNNEVLGSADRDILTNVVNEYVENNCVDTFKISGDIAKLERIRK